MVTSAIWKDTYYTTSATTALTYSIRIDATTGDTIFSGKAYMLPDSNTIKINISDICADYLNNDLSDLSNGAHPNSQAIRNFYLYSGNTLLETYKFTYDWSYETSGATLTPRYAVGQKKFDTLVNSGSVTTNISTFNSSTPYCGRFALLYLQPNGTWSSFIMEGTYKVEDTFNSYTTDKSYNNQTIDFGKNKYINEITTSYELNTGWFNDSESELFAKTIFRSIKVYLQDIPKNKIVPVIITDSTVEYKKYINEKKLISYKIRVEESQNKEIR